MNSFWRALATTACVGTLYVAGCADHHHYDGHTTVIVADEHGYQHEGWRDEHGNWHGGYYDEHQTYHADEHDWYDQNHH